jgi:hypothetical protein
MESLAGHGDAFRRHRVARVPQRRDFDRWAPSPLLTTPERRGTVGAIAFSGVKGVRTMAGRALSSVFALAVTLAALAAGPAAAANLFEENFFMTGPRYDGVVPACDYGSALAKISDRFAQKEGSFWNSALTISGFDKVREVAFRSWAVNTIPRRFCSAIVRISDGSQHPIHYSIGEDTGLLGVTWGVEWCVVGLDRNWAYSPACKMARP